MPTPKVVVIGNSYSAACVFIQLEHLLTKTREPLDLVLVSNRSYYYINDLIPQYLTNSLMLTDFAENFRDIGALRPGVSYLESDILNIDFNAKSIITPCGNIEYKYLILAPGANYNNCTEFTSSNNVLSVLTPYDVIKLQRHILNNLEKAVYENDTEKKKKLMSFAVLGADKQGVETACAVFDFANELISHKYLELNKSFLSVHLVDEKNVLCPAKNPFYSSRLLYNLNKKGIVLYANSSVTDIKDDKIIVNSGKEILAKTIIVSGKKSSSLVNLLTASNQPFLPNVDLSLKLEAFENVYMIGEFARCLDFNEGVLQSCLFLREQAVACANNVYSKINDIPEKPLRLNLNIDFMSLGKRNSMFEFKNIFFDGFFAWFFQRIICAKGFFTWKKKLRAVFSLICFVLGLVDFKYVNVFSEENIKQTVKK